MEESYKDELNMHAMCKIYFWSTKFSLSFGLSAYSFVIKAELLLFIQT
jgi:hypothetical protein